MTEDMARSVAGASTLVRSASASLERDAVDAVTWDRSSILFSACNEDSRSDLRALGSFEGKRVMCVTAGGGRVLNLLVRRPREVWAVDLNPAQNALLELKIAAMRACDHGAYLAFLGVRRAEDRVATYERLRHGLTDGARRFFDGSISIVERGVLTQGRLERFFGRLAVLLRVVRPFGLARLFAFDDLEEQRRYLERWHTPLWRALTRNVARRWVMRVFSGDPGFYRYVPDDVPLHEVIYDGVHDYLWNHVARENPLLQLVFFGAYVYEPALPIYLNADTFDEVKAALRDVHIETVSATVQDVLEHAGPDAFDAFSLSDVSSYVDDDAHDRLFDHVTRAARRRARLCSRSNIHHRPLAPATARRITRDKALEDRLAVDDHSCVHRFLVGEVQ